MRFGSTSPLPLESSRLDRRDNEDPYPSNSARIFERSRYYMQLSDSDDDDKPDHPPLRSSTAPVRIPGVKSSGGGRGKKAVVLFKRDKPVIRERPESAKSFRQIAMDDAEFKVHYRHSNYRRMPFTDKQEQWLEDREAERVLKSRLLAMKLMEDATAKSSKKKKGDKKVAKPSKSKSRSASPSSRSKAAVPEKKKVKYQNAAQFMWVQNVYHI